MTAVECTSLLCLSCSRMTGEGRAGCRSATPLRTSLYQGQLGDLNQPVHGNYKTRF